MKRRQDSGHLIEEIGDVLLARVRVPGPALAPTPSSPSWGPCTPSKPPGPVLPPSRLRTAPGDTPETPLWVYLSL